MPSFVFGTAMKQNKLLCSCLDLGIQVIDLSSSVLTKINAPTGDMSAFSYFTSFQDKIYYTDLGKHFVVCCDLKGKIIWKFRDQAVLKAPSCIDIDGNGFVYVIGKRTCNVVVISPDGRKCRQLLTKKDGLENAQALSCDKQANELLIANSCNIIFRYKLEL